MLLRKTSFTILLSFFLALFLLSCDDSTDSVSNGDPSDTDVPVIPSFSEMQMQTDLFDGAGYTVGKKVPSDASWIDRQARLTANALKPITESEIQFLPDEFPAYFVAAQLVGAFESMHQTNVGLLQNFFAEWTEDGAELSNGEYVWEYEVDDFETGETFYIRINAAVSGDQANWVVIAEMEGGFDEQQIMEGTTALDGSTGEWTFTMDIPEDDYSLVTTSSWVFDGEEMTEMELDLSMESVGAVIDAEGKYEMDDNTGRIYDAWIDSPSVEEASENIPYDVDLTQMFNVEWDIQDGDGSLTIGNDRFCWNTNQSLIDC